eukprot:9019257-Pyramimonas_sp.AAC.2
MFTHLSVSIPQHLYNRLSINTDLKPIGATSLIRCLREALCLPVGAYSVFSQLTSSNSSTMATTVHHDSSHTHTEPGQETSKKPLPVVLVLAHLDSASFFHDLALGADVPLSGLLIMLTAVELLSRWGYTRTGEPRHAARVAFAALAGEDWGYVGSQHMIADLQAGSDNVGGVKLDDVK